MTMNMKMRAFAKRSAHTHGTHTHARAGMRAFGCVRAMPVSDWRN